MDHEEILFLGKEGFVGGACGGVKDEFVKGCCREAWGGKEDREGFGEVDVPEEGIEEGLEELLEALLHVRINNLVTFFCAVERGSSGIACYTYPIVASTSNPLPWHPYLNPLSQDRSLPRQNRYVRQSLLHNHRPRPSSLLCITCLPYNLPTHTVPPFGLF